MACIMVIVGCISLSHAMMEKEKTSSRKGGRKIFISFMALSDWKIVFRLNYCLPFMEPKRGKNLKKYFPKSALFCLSSCMLSHFIFFLPTYTSLQVISHSTFFPLQNIPCEAIIFDLLRSPKLYFCSFLLLMPCHTVRNNKLAFTSCSLTLSIAAKNFLQRENCEEGEGELCGSMASQ